MAKLSPSVRQKVVDLLSTGKESKREIQRITKVSRPTIDKIEKELLHPQEKVPPKKPKKLSFVRCKGCGGKVNADKPCLACSIQKEVWKSYDEYMESLIGPIPSSPKKLEKGS